MTKDQFLNLQSGVTISSPIGNIWIVLEHIGFLSSKILYVQCLYSRESDQIGIHAILYEEDVKPWLIYHD